MNYPIEEINFIKPIFHGLKAFKNVNSFLLHVLSQRPVAFNPELGRLAGSAIAGLFLSQLLYWLGKGHKKGYVYKTINEFQEETCLTRSEQDRAIKIWKELRVLNVKLKGVPPKRYFSVNIGVLVRLLGYSQEDADYLAEKTT